MNDDDWVKSAMADKSLVADLLTRMSSSGFYTCTPAKKPVKLPPVNWSLRQPRSRHIPRRNTVQVKKEGELTRASPSTPLSWSGGTSVSGGGTGDCFEESSFPAKQPSPGVRSKVNGTSETVIRRSKKKKTFFELKEEESFLVKERIHLKKALAAIRIAFEGQKIKHEKVKRIKLDLQLISEKQIGQPFNEPKDEISNRSCHIETASIDQTTNLLRTSNTDSFKVEEKDATNHKSSFTLPDLNMPIEDESGFV